MTKMKRNLIGKLMEGMDAMRAHRKERRNIGKETLEGLREIKQAQLGVNPNGQQS